MQPSFPALDTLISDVEAEAAKQPDMVALLSCVARLIIHSDADAYRVIGVLIEATATALDERMPLENRGAVAVETMRLLRDRLAERGVI